MAPPIRRRRNSNQRRSWLVSLLSDVWHVGSPSFLSTLIVWVIAFYKSASSSPCLHNIGIPLFFTNLGLCILSFYMVCKIGIIMIRLLDYEGEKISRSAKTKMFKDWYKWAVLMIAVVLVLIVLELFEFDNAAPWVSVVYALSGACLVVGYYIMTKNRWTAIVAKDRDEQPADQELNSWSARAGVDLSRAILTRKQMIASLVSLILVIGWMGAWMIE